MTNDLKVIIQYKKCKL